MVRAADEDDLLRASAFALLGKLSATGGGAVSWHDLQRFEFGGRRIPLVGQTGIRKVRGYEAALTILTTYRLRPEDRPYEDDIGPDGYPRYKWRGTEAGHADNAALRRAMELGKALAWLEGVEPGVYLVHVPVWLVGEEPEQHQFVVALDETMREQWQPETFLTAPDLALRREYASTVVRRRLHQPMFRRRVLAAYRTQCALCRLRHGELLDAAHIKEDSEGGEPVVPNGIAMCAIHHRAFDSFVLGVRPDYVIEVRRDVLDEVDGPTLQHALQGVHGSSLSVPGRRSARPDTGLLEERYDRFRLAG
ncbi:MAG: HNH endonuclease [Actinomycetota bacterium]